jgi:hypothetical protein
MGRLALHLSPRVGDFWTIDLRRWRRRLGKIGYRSVLAFRVGGMQVRSVNYEIEDGAVRLTYYYTFDDGTQRLVDERVGIVTSSTNFGGRRHWFRCPSCLRRCQFLYGGSHFRCRTCQGAKYDSQYDRPLFRIYEPRWRIRESLRKRGSSECSSLDEFPERPPRMHRKTYERLKARDQELALSVSVRARGRLR